MKTFTCDWCGADHKKLITTCRICAKTPEIARADLAAHLKAGPHFSLWTVEKLDRMVAIEATRKARGLFYTAIP